MSSRLGPGRGKPTSETALTATHGGVGIPPDLPHNPPRGSAITTTESGLVRLGCFPTLTWLSGVILCAALAAGTVRAQTQQPVHPRPMRVDALEQRVQLLTHELDLKPEQQEAVRQILRGQREAVRQIWQDPQIAPAERAPAVRLVGERTADRIRAVLNDEQKKKYNRPLPDEALSTQANVDVDGWLKAVRSRETP